MFILYSNIVKDHVDIEENVKGFHLTISNTFHDTFHQTITNTFHQTFHETISNTFGRTIHETIHQTISNTFGGTVRKIIRETVHTHLSLSHPYPVIPLISR